MQSDEFSTRKVIMVCRVDYLPLYSWYYQQALAFVVTHWIGWPENLQRLNDNFYHYYLVGYITVDCITSIPVPMSH